MHEPEVNSAHKTIVNDEQEPNLINNQEPDHEHKPAVKRKLSMFAIGVAAVISLVILAGIGISYGIFSNSYNANLDKLKAMVAQTETQFASGNNSDDADAKDQVRHYSAMNGQIGTLAGILKKLNDAYPLLLGRASEQSLGIAALADKMEQLSPKLDTLNVCIGEDAAISARLAELLGGGVQDGLTGEYEALVSRNDALSVKINGLSFFAALEANRLQLSGSIAKRGTALAFLLGDASVNEQFTALLADSESVPADNVTKLNEMLARNNELTNKAEEANITGYGSGAEIIEQALGSRMEMIQAGIGYFTELAPLWNSAQSFSSQVDKSAVQSGKFTAKLAVYMSWVNPLQELNKQLKAVNDKPEYAIMPSTSKRTINGIGLSPDGQALSGYLDALVAANTAVATSNAIEKEITSLMANKTMTLVKRITALEKLLTKNENLVASLSVEVPPELVDGFASFTEGCTERTTFINEYMSYTLDNVSAGSIYSSYKGYLNLYKVDLVEAKKFPVGSDDYITWTNIANDQLTLANAAKANYNASLKLADAHKKLYEASRKKYLPLLSK